MTLIDLVRELDPASTELTDAQQRRADALLERVVHEPDAATNPARVSRRRLLRVGGLVTAGAGAAAIAVGLSGIFAAPAAVATWTAEPEVVAPADLAVAEDTCREQASRGPSGADLTLVASERRGSIVAILLSRDDPQSTFACVVELATNASTPREVTWGGSGGTSPVQTPAADGYWSNGESQLVIGGEILSIVSGSVGDDVESISLRGSDVTGTATIDDGRYFAWLPGPIFWGTDIPSGFANPELTLAFDLHLTDGTTIADAEPRRG